MNDVEVLADVDVGKNRSMMQWDRAIGPANFRNAEYRMNENRDAVKVQTINAWREEKKKVVLGAADGRVSIYLRNVGRVQGREVEECEPLYSLLVTPVGPSVGWHAANDNTS